VPRQDSARQQFELARQNPSLEAGWRAVLENYPNDLFYRPRAEFEIAWICLAEGRNDEAEVLFKSLASYSEIDSNARAAGLAGLSIILSLKNEHARSQELMLQVIPLARERMLDPRLRTPLTKAAERNREALKSQTSPDWDKIFEEADTRRNGG
jgi:hypothetical protein